MGGSLAEHVRDWFLPYAARCDLDPVGLSRDPECEDRGASYGRSSRGSYFEGGILTAWGAARYFGDPASALIGFRCVYPVAAP